MGSRQSAEAQQEELRRLGHPLELVRPAGLWLRLRFLVEEVSDHQFEDRQGGWT